MKKISNIYNKNKEIINYLIFGFLATIVSLVSYYFFTCTFLNPSIPIELQLANVFSWVLAVTFAYVTNRKFVFESKNSNVKKEIFNFLIARLITLVMDMLIMYVGVITLHGNDKILKIISQIVVIVSNYVFSKLFVFKKKKYI